MLGKNRKFCAHFPARCSFDRLLLICPLVCSFARSFAHLPTRLLICLLICSFARSFAPLPAILLIYPLVCSLARSFAPLPAH